MKNGPKKTPGLGMIVAARYPSSCSGVRLARSVGGALESDILG